jgi:hypothetical protein
MDLNLKYKYFRKGNYVRIGQDKFWKKIANDIQQDGEVHLERVLPVDNSEIPDDIKIQDLKEVEINAQIWEDDQFRFLFKFEGDDVAYKQQHGNELKQSEINHFHARGYYKEPYDPKILFEKRELKRLKKAIIEDGKRFFLNQLQNYLEDNNLEEVDIPSTIDQINKPKSK